MTPDLILARLAQVRRTGHGWSARCPAHQDRRNSLSVALAPPDRLLLHCFAGCRPEEVLAALGLTWRDLFEPRGPGGRPAAAAPKRVYRDVLQEAEEAVVQREQRAQERREFYRPLMEAGEAIRKQHRITQELRTIATKLGPSELVWDALEFTARAEMNLANLEAELDRLLAEGPFRPSV